MGNKGDKLCSICRGFEITVCAAFSSVAITGPMIFVVVKTLTDFAVLVIKAIHQ